MKTITMLELRQRARSVVREVAAGQRYTVSYRGKVVMKLEPPDPPRKRPPKDDPFYRLAELAEDMGESLTNEQMDRIIYEY